MYLNLSYIFNCASFLFYSVNSIIMLLLLSKLLLFLTIISEGITVSSMARTMGHFDLLMSDDVASRSKVYHRVSHSPRNLIIISIISTRISF